MMMMTKIIILRMMRTRKILQMKMTRTRKVLQMKMMRSLTKARALTHVHVNIVIQRTQLIGDTIVMENMSIVLTGLNMRMKMMKVIIARLRKYCLKQKKIKKMCNFIVQQLYFSGEIRLFS